MSGLILKLRPFEEILINGAVVENGEYKTRIRIKSESVNILRLRDAIAGKDATTPLKQAYFIAQCAVSGELPPDVAGDQIKIALLKVAVEGSCSADLFQRIEEARKSGDFYCAMRSIGALMKQNGEALHPQRKAIAGATSR